MTRSKPSDEQARKRAKLQAGIVIAVRLALGIVGVDQHDLPARAAGERARLVIDRITERSTARCTRSRVSGRTFAPLLSTRETVTRATPAALATSSIVELRFVTRVGWQAIQHVRNGVELACQQPKPAP